MRSRSSATPVAWAALVTSIAALVIAASGIAGASGGGGGKGGGHRGRAHQGAVVRLGADGKIPARELPSTVAKARNAMRLDGQAAASLTPSCPAMTTDLGTWCLMTAPYSVPASQAGHNNYFWATQACVALGGYLPTAAQLIGAANKVPLESVLTDNPATSTIESDPTVGIQDQREMSATLVTTAAGSDAAGSEGVSVGATGNPAENQPNPTPEPADPEPETLQYVTVYDNHQRGGFAGSEPVSQAENFRCAFDKVPAADRPTVTP
jgi:hypothetical protein